jgi:hypothetical protein
VKINIFSQKNVSLSYFLPNIKLSLYINKYIWIEYIGTRLSDSLHYSSRETDQYMNIENAVFSQGPYSTMVPWCYIFYRGAILWNFDAASLNSGFLACWRLWRQNITTKWLKGILFIRCGCGCLHEHRLRTFSSISYELLYLLKGIYSNIWN